MSADYKYSVTYDSYPEGRPIYYCGDELHDAKQEKLEKLLTEWELDAVLFVRSEIVRYITDFFVKGYRPFFELEYLVVALRNRRIVMGYISGSDSHRIKLRNSVKDCRRLPRPTEWPEVISEIFRDYNLTQGRVGIDILPYFMKERLEKEFPRIDFIDANRLWMELTVIKHPIEIEYIKQSLELIKIGMEAAVFAAKPGVREVEVAAEAEYAMRRGGSEFNPTITHVASGINASIFERVATDKRISDGEAVMIDLTSSFRGYTGDGGRTIFAGGKCTSEQRSIYKVCFEALKESVAAVKPGTKCLDPDLAARRVIENSVYKQYSYKSATGHQLGYGLKGEPLIKQGEEFVIQPNMVFALEPRIVCFDRPDIGGVHLEDVLLVTEYGSETLTKMPYEQQLL